MNTSDSAQKLVEAIRIHYNFCREHSSLEKTPAEQAGIKLNLGQNKIEGLLKLSKNKDMLNIPSSTLENMITAISLENIKSIKENQEIILPSFTLLIGDNGSGKSSFLQILSLLSQNPLTPSLADGQICRQGGYQQLCYDDTKPIIITIRGIINVNSDGYNYLNKLHYQLEFHYSRRSNNIGASFCKIESEDPNDFFRTKIGQQNKILFDNRRSQGQSQSITFDNVMYDETWGKQFNVKLAYEQPWRYAVTSWIQSIPAEAQRRLQRFLESIDATFYKEFENIAFVPALRGIDTQKQELLETVAGQPVDAYNFNNQAKLLASSLAYHRDLEDKVSDLIAIILNRKCRANLEEGRVISVETKVGERWVNIMNEGFGVNPMVHLIYQLVSAPPNSIILIEEPEIHLFPAAQKRLIIELIKQAKKENKKLLITTHSAHVYSVLSQIKENHDSDVKIYFFKKDPDIETQITEVTQENRDGILRDFMKMDIEELADLIESAGI